MPLRPLSLLVLLLHVYVALRLVPALGALDAGSGGAVAQVAVTLLLALSAITIPLPFATRRGRKPPLAALWNWLGLIAMGWFSSLFLLTLLRDLGLLGLWFASVIGGWAVDWPSWRAQSAAAVLLLATAVTALGFFNARRTAKVRRIDVPIANLPAALDGFAIAQISDLHVGPTIRRGYIERIVGAVNALEADAIALTGDLVDGSVADLREHIAPLADLRARHGAFVVTGNHEYYAGAGPWIAELRRIGLTVLLNEHVLLAGAARSGAMHAGATGADTERAGTRGADAARTGVGVSDAIDPADLLVLAGVTDFSAAHFDAAQTSDPVRALHGAPPSATARVLLAHQPRSAPSAAAAGFALQLSGHTHGGQFFPWNLMVPMQQPFTAGLHRLAGMWIYVSRGTGYWGPPKRFGAPSEITFVRLVRAADAG